MPVKKIILTDAERAKRIRETALKIETSNDPEAMERAFSKVVKSNPISSTTSLPADKQSK
jgi:hypothetical protein